ncbi:unnamed protein product [Rangifer tarandus platyrhynchus]|uniref:Uncharacterized protein n=1 Tax=Rangifer tarandus platyrhynchus TaxID=3082113 RepID=A0AC60A8Q5_RANTA
MGADLTRQADSTLATIPLRTQPLVSERGPVYYWVALAPSPDPRYNSAVALCCFVAASDECPSCRKGWLPTPPLRALVTPTSLESLQCVGQEGSRPLAWFLLNFDFCI